MSSHDDATGRRLYRVEIRTEILVLAEDDRDAERIAEYEATRNVDDWDVHADSVDSEREFPYGWRRGDLVYHDGDLDDVSAADALAISLASERAEKLAAMSPAEREAYERAQAHAVGQLTLDDVAPEAEP